MMKRLIVIFLSVAFLLSLVGCSEKKDEVVALPTEKAVEQKTTEYSEFEWPKSEIAGLLPVPKSNIGKIEWEGSHGFVIYVGETLKEQYDDYVDECQEKGFTVAYKKGDDFFWADNKSGYHVSLRYEGDNIMFLRIDEPKKTEDETSESSVKATVVPTKKPAPTKKPDKSTSTVEWKQFLKDYEKWVDDYIKLMEKYKKNPADMSILEDYTTAITEITEWAEKADKVELDLKNDPDALSEYLETLSRIVNKLSKV